MKSIRAALENEVRHAKYDTGMEKKGDTISRLRDVPNTFCGSCEFGKNDGLSNSERVKRIEHDGNSPLIDWRFPHGYDITDIEVPKKIGSYPRRVWGCFPQNISRFAPFQQSLAAEWLW